MTEARPGNGCNEVECCRRLICSRMAANSPYHIQLAVRYRPHSSENADRGFLHERLSYA